MRVVTALKKRATAHGIAVTWFPVLGRTGADLIHDAADCARAPAAFGAASEATIDLAGAPHRALARNGPHLLVRNDIARTNDHRSLRFGSAVRHPPISMEYSIDRVIHALFQKWADPDEDVLLPRRRRVPQPQ